MSIQTQGNIGDIAANFRRGADNGTMTADAINHTMEGWKEIDGNMGKIWNKIENGLNFDANNICAFSPHMWIACMFLFIAAGVRLYDAGNQNNKDTQEISHGRGSQLRFAAGLCIAFGCLLSVPTVIRIFMKCPPTGYTHDKILWHLYNVFYVVIGAILIGSGSIYIKWSNQHNGEVNKKSDRTLGTMFIIVGITMLIQVFAYVIRHWDSAFQTGTNIYLSVSLSSLIMFGVGGGLFAGLYYGLIK